MPMPANLPGWRGTVQGNSSLNSFRPLRPSAGDDLAHAARRQAELARKGLHVAAAPPSKDFLAHALPVLCATRRDVDAHARQARLQALDHGGRGLVGSTDTETVGDGPGFCADDLDGVQFV